MNPAAIRDWRGFLSLWSFLLRIMVTFRKRKCILSFRLWCLRLGCACLHVREGDSVDMYMSCYTLYPAPHPRQTLWKHFSIMAVWTSLMRWGHCLLSLHGHLGRMKGKTKNKGHSMSSVHKGQAHTWILFHIWWPQPKLLITLTLSVPPREKRGHR